MPHNIPIADHISLALGASPSPSADIRSALRDAIAKLESVQTPSAPLAAELLLMHTLGVDRTYLYAHPVQELDAATWERYFSLVARRASGVPTQHLTGHQEFWGLDFEVTPDVLIPRPETEHLIEVAFERLGAGAGDDSQGRCAPLRIADVGTGSGCIAIALAKELPNAQIIGTDISAAAIEIARRNAARHEVSQRIEFVECNLLDRLLTGSCSLDLIASNPPYIGRCEAASLPREVREHEPEAALFGGETGTEIYAPLIAQAASLLKPGGILILEMGHTSANHVSCLLGPPAWRDVTITNDLAGIQRVISALRV